MQLDREMSSKEPNKNAIMSLLAKMLEGYPLSHNGRIMIVNGYLAVDERERALLCLSATLALYPESAIALRLLTSVVKDVEQPVVRKLLEERRANLEKQMSR